MKQVFTIQYTLNNRNRLLQSRHPKCALNMPRQPHSDVCEFFRHLHVDVNSTIGRVDGEIQAGNGVWTEKISG